MKTRVISALFMLPLLIFVWFGGIPLFGICVVLSAMGLWEFYRGFENLDIHAGKVLGYVSSAALYVIMFWTHFISSDHFDYSDYILAWLFLTVFFGLSMCLVREDHNIKDGTITIIGVIYVTFCLLHVSLVSTLDGGNKLVWLIFLIAFGTDTCAYFGGYFFGKHKLCPTLSPKKTIEGAVSGVLGTVILCGIFTAIFLGVHEIPLICLMALLGSPIAQCGDLIASGFKRKMGIKDYSNLIPGHGGIMDRFDSVAMVAPFVYYFIQIVR